MTIDFKCPSCDKPLHAPSHLAGTKSRGTGNTQVAVTVPQLPDHLWPPGLKPPRPVRQRSTWKPSATRCGQHALGTAGSLVDVARRRRLSIGHIEQLGDGRRTHLLPLRREPRPAGDLAFRKTRPHWLLRGSVAAPIAATVAAPVAAPVAEPLQVASPAGTASKSGILHDPAAPTTCRNRTAVINGASKGPIPLAALRGCRAAVDRRFREPFRPRRPGT